MSIKTSFEPISNSETTILILGTIPGDKSLELGEYYGHPRNRFWKIISTITGNEMPQSYDEKKGLLRKMNIGVWDVAHNAIRPGSLDSDIRNEQPNDLETFIENLPNLKVIGFNGAKAQALFDKHFERKNGIRYLALPSTSPANAAIGFEDICKKWRQLIAE